MSDQPQPADHLLKVSCLLIRRSDLTHEEFFRYWTEKHTPMLAKPQPGAPKVHRYVQRHPIAETVPGLQTAQPPTTGWPKYGLITWLMPRPCSPPTTYP